MGFIWGVFTTRGTHKRTEQQLQTPRRRAPELSDIIHDAGIRAREMCSPWLKDGVHRNLDELSKAINRLDCIEDGEDAASDVLARALMTALYLRELVRRPVIWSDTSPN